MEERIGSTAWYKKAAEQMRDDMCAAAMHQVQICHQSGYKRILPDLLMQVAKFHMLPRIYMAMQFATSISNHVQTYFNLKKENERTLEIFRKEHARSKQGNRPTD